MYYFLDLEDGISGQTVRHIFTLHGDGYTSFPLTDDNPNTPAFEAWVEAGNTPEPWNP